MVNLSFINLQHLECTEKNINATRKLLPYMNAAYDTKTRFDFLHITQPLKKRSKVVFVSTKQSRK